MTIAVDIQKLDLDAEIRLYELDTTAFVGGSIDRFHDGSNEFNGDVIWDGNVYSAAPIQARGFERNSDGTLPRPRVRFANVEGFFWNVNAQFQDLVGAKFTQITTLAKYMDAGNFIGGNPNADPTQKMSDEIWSVFRKVGVNKNVAEYELSSPWDVQGLELPRGTVVPNICPWSYRGVECGYAGGAVAKLDDTPTAIMGEDDCGKRLTSCKLRFGAAGELPFGGFPGVGLVG